MIFTPRDFHRGTEPFQFDKWSRLKPMLRKRGFQVRSEFRIGFETVFNRWYVIDGIVIGWVEYDESPLLFRDMHEDWSGLFEPPTLHCLISDALMNIRNQGAGK